MSDLNSLVERVTTAAFHNGWDDRFYEMENGSVTQKEHITAKIMLAVSELAEAVEELRDGRDYTETYYLDDGKPEGFGTELADAVIRILHIAGLINIDLEARIQEKLRYNAGRGHRHGGKVL